MEEHEDRDTHSIQKSSVVDSTAVDEVVTGRLGGGEGKTEGLLAERDEGEDMMVDVVGADEVDGDHGRDDLDGKTGSVRLVEECMQRETETYEQNMDTEETAGLGSGEDVCHFEKVDVTVKEEGLKRSLEARKDVLQDSDRVLTIEKVEVVVKEEGLKRSLEASKDILQDDSDRVLTIEKVEVAVKEEGLKKSLEACKDVLQDSDRVLTIEKVEGAVKEEGLQRSLEASKDVLQDSDYDAQKSGTSVRDSELAIESSRVEPQSGRGDIAVIDSKELMERGLTEVVVEQNIESVEAVAGGDHVVDGKPEKEGEILDSSKIAESSTPTASLGAMEIDTIVVEEGFVSKDEAQDSVSVDPSSVCDNNQNSSTELVNAGKDEDGGRSKEESLHPTIEVLTDDSQRRENGLVDMEESERGLSKEIMERPMECEQVPDGDCIVNEKIGKECEALDSTTISEPSTTTNPGFEDDDVVVVDEGLACQDEARDGVSVDPSLVSDNNQNSSTELVNAGTDEVAGRSKEESPHPTIKVITDDSQRRDNGLIDMEESERNLSKEIMEMPMEYEQVADRDRCVNKKVGKESEALDSSTISEPSTTTNPGFEDVDVVVDEGLACKDEAQDGVSVDPSLICANNRSLSTGEDDVSVQAENLDQQAEVAKLSKNKSFHPTTEVITNDSQKPENGTGVGDSKLAAEPSNEEPLFGGETAVKDREETERGLTEDKEIVEQHTGSVQEVTYEDRVVDEKIGNEDEVLDSSKIPASLTTANLGSAEVLTTEVEAQDSKSVGPRVNDEEIVKQHTESVQEVTHGDGVMDEKTGNGYHVLDSSKTSVSLTTANLGPEEVLTTKVEAQDSDSVGQRLVCPDNQVVNAFEEVNGVTPCADVAKDYVLHEDSGFSYEDAHMERGEDAGMDIDEVLGWKDEMPEIDVVSSNADHPETDQDINKINTNSEGVVEQGLLESSCEPVAIGQQEENCKSRQPIVYERRVHVEVPLYDSLDGSRSPLLEDENLKVETDSEEDDESVQEEEKKAIGRSRNEVTENESSCSLQQSCYFQPREKGQFAVSDLVWGKIRSHPWWPGQIFNPSDASEKAMKYHKKGCFLVAYFGDGTFAWNDSAVLKPFRPNFSQIEKNTNSEAFKNAVTCALEEVSRRVELGLACSCVPHEIYETIEYQNVENGGIRKKSNKRFGADESAGVSSFEPDKLVDYVRFLAQFPSEGDKMEIVMAKAQLSSYGHYKGYRELPEFQFCGEILEEDASMISEGVEPVNNHGVKISEKSENNLINGEYPTKDRSLSDLTDDTPCSGDGDRTEGGNVTSSSLVSSSSGLKKRKARDSVSNGSKKRPSFRLEKVASAQVSTPKPSFKVGECIQRVASQLTGPPLVLKSNSDPNGQHVDQLVGLGPAVSLQIPENSGTERMIVESKQSSVAEMLSQLQLVAQDPMKGYSFLNTITPFFYDRRTAVFSKSIRQNPSVGRPVSSGKKRKTSNENEPEEFEFEFDDVNDSYWTDRIIQNHSEEQSLQDNQNEGQECHVVAYEPEKPAKAGRKSNKKRVLSSNPEIESKEQSELVERRRQNLATEVILKFTEGIYFPSEIHLNKMFRRFGALMESETEVNRQNGRARVVFKKCSDAEVAHSSAGKFNIFGSIGVNYELNYTPLVSYKPLPLPMSQDPMDAS